MLFQLVAYHIIRVLLQMAQLRTEIAFHTVNSNTKRADALRWLSRYQCTVFSTARKECTHSVLHRKVAVYSQAKGKRERSRNRGLLCKSIINYPQIVASRYCRVPTARWKRSFCHCPLPACEHRPRSWTRADSWWIRSWKLTVRI